MYEKKYVQNYPTCYDIQYYMNSYNQIYIKAQNYSISVRKFQSAKRYTK